MHKHDGKWRFYSVLISCILAGMSCKLPGLMETQPAFTITSTALAASVTPTEAAPVDTATPTETKLVYTATFSPIPPSPTATPTETEPVPTDTSSPIPPSPTATPLPATDTLDLSGWFAVIGTWSGCVVDPSPGVPYYATPCSAPSGNFVTLWIKSSCAIGEYCGNYVKGRFESEFIRLKLSLLGIHGPTVWMHGEADAMFPEASTDVTIVYEGGSKVRITEKAGQKYIHVLPRGCDRVIIENTGIGCYEYLS
jgi:hypothetical protein